jgi:quercetin dioxygenase-like cupin family protein
MDKLEFDAQLRADGFVEIETKSLMSRPANDAHGHPFAVRGLVLAGAFTVAQAGQSKTYKPGEVFAVDANQPHTEEVGAEGAQVLVGRKY